ncbi:hypothetical protein CTAYLR_003150 [Chrysophaeum taylorii]|uniref:TauD/TfdA-like domain-containing protein n=1 Tax=Chrysophaeum taylorii TaxID=2483200 RepID=A0AAD7UP62_9STRA|nr:hypothetical protein CTAYLR_003150 [Chrysophaeum taylorii]
MILRRVAAYPAARVGYPADPVAFDGTVASWGKQMGWGSGSYVDRVVAEREVRLERISEDLDWGCAFTGIGLDEPEARTEEFHAVLADLIHRFQLVLFKRQRLTPERHVELARKLCPHLGAKLPPTSAADNGFKPEDLVPGLPEIAVLGSKPFDDPSNYYGKPVNNSVKGVQWPLFGPCSWHCDGAAFETPGSFTFVHMPRAPVKGQGGATLYGSGYDVYDSLPEDLRQRAEKATIRYIEDGAWEFEYDMKHNGMRRLNKPGQVETTWHHQHRLVQTHPVTGRKAVWTAPANVMAADDQDLVEAVLECGIKRTYAHFYDDGDVCISDDRAMLHSTTPFGPDAGARILHRCGTELRSLPNRRKSFQYLYNVPGSNLNGQMSFKPGHDLAPAQIE